MHEQGRAMRVTGMHHPHQARTSWRVFWGGLKGSQKETTNLEVLPESDNITRQFSEYAFHPLLCLLAGTTTKKHICRTCRTVRLRQLDWNLPAALFDQTQRWRRGRNSSNQPRDQIPRGTAAQGLSRLSSPGEISRSAHFANRRSGTSGHLAIPCGLLACNSQESKDILLDLRDPVIYPWSPFVPKDVQFPDSWGQRQALVASI